MATGIGAASADDWGVFDKWRAGRGDGIPLYLHHPAHSTAQDTCTPGFLWQGAGNPAITMQRKRNLTAGIELAIKGIERFGPDQPATYMDSDGVVHIEVPAGQSAPNRAAWNFTYSYDVALNGANPPLANYQAWLLIDLDPSKKAKYLPLKLAKLATYPALPCAAEPDLNGYGWKNGNTIVIGDDEGTDQVTQNSQNLGFYLSQIDGDPNTSGIQPYTFTPGQFDVQMIILKPWDLKTLTVVHVAFDVVTAPSQTP
jgi:hypothetical protein